MMSFIVTIAQHFFCLKKAQIFFFYLPSVFHFYQLCINVDSKTEEETKPPFVFRLHMKGRAA